MSAFPGSKSPLACAAVALALVVGGVPRLPAAQAGGGPDVAAILYDGPTDPHSSPYVHALFLENLLTHFKLRGELIPLAAYRPGRLGGYRAGFFIGATPEAKVPGALLADIRKSEKPFAWLGMHIDQLLATPEARRALGFDFVEYRRDLGFARVRYKDTLLAKMESDLSIISITDPKAVSVIATALDRAGRSQPYVVRRGAFWYFADSPFSHLTEGSRYLVICDLLHDILGIDHPSDTRALVRIEDVSVDDEPDDLNKIADLLEGRHVPFQISLIPLFLDPGHSLEIHLGDRRRTVDAIHYMIAHGGTPIMHGTTHQYRGVSADDYEFWDEMADRPIGGDSSALVLDRLRQGLLECFDNGIYPLAFETPHYGASASDYAAIARVFSESNERPMVAPDVTTTEFAPYPFVDHAGRYIVPEDLGYLPEANPDPKLVIDRARSLRVVRDGIASFYFHPFLDRSLLDQTVRGIQDLGYRFVSLREFGGSVDLDGRYAVRSASGKVRLTPRDEYWRMRRFNAQGQEIERVVSPQRFKAPVEVTVSVPEQGWVVLDCLKRLPQQEQQEKTWVTRLGEWWRGNPDARRASGSITAWLLWQKGATGAVFHNQESYRSTLELFGYRTKLVTADKFSRPPADGTVVLVVPQAAGSLLKPKQQDQVVSFLKDGGSLVADGRQAWLQQLGFAFPGGRMTVGAVSDLDHADTVLAWRPEQRIERFTAPEGVEELMVDGQGRRPLAVTGTLGAGRYLYLAAPLDNHTDEGTSHYPYFAEYLRAAFGPGTPLRSHRLEVYCDPSYRPGADWNRMATIWRRSGIGVVYVAAWLFSRQFTFPYPDFIQACHRNGIAVYAWYVFPAVTPKMWDEHPEWREKTATGADGRVGWRYSMDLENPACFRAAMDWMKQQLESGEWDGVNIAELNFDADTKDWLRADRFIPMNNTVRAAFRRASGFDPVELFRPGSAHYFKTNPGALAAFLRYREDIVVDWHRRVLAELEPIRKQRGWEVIVTALDSLHSPVVQSALGVDSRRIVALMKEFPFTLQVEDPVQFWADPADRYLRFAASYRKLISDPRRLMFDVNAVKERDRSHVFLPSAEAVGTELARTVSSAASASGRAAIYSEFTVGTQDWSLIRTALGHASVADSRRNGWLTSSGSSLLLTPADNAQYYLDGRVWPAVSTDGALVPAGRHVLSTSRSWRNLFDSGAENPRLISCTGDLLAAQSDATSLTLRYSSPGRAVVLISQRPHEILVDGEAEDLPFEPSSRDWSVVLPAGEHQVQVTTNTTAGVAVNVWGWASSSLIALGGALATLTMLGIYLQIRMRRLARRRG